MKRACVICGEEFEERDMETYSPSPGHPQYICWECYKQSQYEVGKSEIHRMQRRYQIMKEKGLIK